MAIGILNFKFTKHVGTARYGRHNRYKKFPYLWHPAQITIDVLFDYLYYLPDTVKSDPDSHPNQSGKDGECRNRRGMESVMVIVFPSVRYVDDCVG